MEGNTSVYQVNSVSRITGEGRAEFLRAWGHGLEQEGAGKGGGVICVNPLATAKTYGTLIPSSFSPKTLVRFEEYE